MYSEGHVQESFETLKKRDVECYTILKKQIDAFTKDTPEAMFAQKNAILDTVWARVDKKFEIQTGTIKMDVETQFRKM